MDGIGHVSHLEFHVIMKRILLLIILLGLLASMGWLFFSIQEKEENEELVEERVKSIPSIALKSPAGQEVLILDLSKGTGTLLIYFNSTCEICQLELQKIEERIADFKKGQIILVSSQELKELESFIDSNPWIKSPNVHLLLDEEMEVAAYYGVRSVPSIFCYDSDGILKGKYNGFTKVDLLLKGIGVEAEVEP